MSLIDRARNLGDQPIEGRHPGAAILVVGVMVAIAALLLSVRSDPPPPKAATVAAPAPATPAAPRQIERRAPSPSLTPQTLRSAKSAARRFLTGYLPYTYGEAPASRIRSSSSQLRKALADNPPRPPAGERRRARVDVLQADHGATADRVPVLALVSDGKRHYSVRMTVERVDGSWRVTRIGEG